MIVIAWETTRHCILRCRHCRGAATEARSSRELTSSEGLRMIRQIADRFENPMLILTGGEPMSRPDIWTLAETAVKAGIRTVMSPCGPLITESTAKQMLNAGISRISVSLDGADAVTHDDFRGIPGIFKQTLAGIAHAKASGVSFQINSTISKLNAHQIPQILGLAQTLGADALDLFFLVPTGRGKALADLALSADEHEVTLQKTAKLSLSSPIPIRVTCAPHYVRIREELGMKTIPGHGGGSQGCLAGRRFLFVSHEGIVQPCGFLQLNCGNLRDCDFDLKSVYDTSVVLQNLRNPDIYQGACGSCMYRQRCGGCRARAYEHCGDYLAAEPFCQLAERMK